MGRTYLFECPKCGYKAKVSGRADEGRSFFVQTIHCRNCKKLYDTVTRHKVEQTGLHSGFGLQNTRPRKTRKTAGPPPSFDTVFNEMPTVARRMVWKEYKLYCPVSPVHRVQPWNDPGRCPRCSVFMEKSPLPFRFWE